MRNRKRHAKNHINGWQCGVFMISFASYMKRFYHMWCLLLFKKKTYDSNKTKTEKKRTSMFHGVKKKMKKLLLGRIMIDRKSYLYCLQLLDLSRNRLNGFDDSFTWKLRQIKDVKLANNPLICDRCHMGALIDIAQTVRIALDIYKYGNVLAYQMTNKMNNIERRQSLIRIEGLAKKTLVWYNAFECDLYTLSYVHLLFFVYVQ